MKLIRKILLLCAMAAISSCGKFFEFETDKPMPDGLAISHHEIDLHVGDFIDFETTLKPDSIVASYYWTVEGDEEAVRCGLDPEGGKARKLRPAVPAHKAGDQGVAVDCAEQGDAQKLGRQELAGQQLTAGDDAADAQWYTLTQEADRIILRRGAEVLTADDLAFDHGAILRAALSMLR